MIGLFGSAAGRAIANKKQQQSTPVKQSNNHLSHKKQQLSKMTAKSKSLDYEIHVDEHESDSKNLAKIHEKKSKFWKLFESEKIKNSLEDISTSSSKNR